MSTAAELAIRIPAGATPAAHTAIARVAVFDTPGAVEPIWRALEGSDHLSTVYQRYDFLAAWQRHVGPHEGCTPAVAVAYDAGGKALLLVPLTLYTALGVTLARCMGGKHANLNMPLYDRTFAQSATRADMESFVTLLGAAMPHADVLILTQQPLEWRGTRNPMAYLPNQPSANLYPRLVYPAADAPQDIISSSMRKRLRGKERKLQALSGYQFMTAASDTDIAMLADNFFRNKPAHMAAQKLPNVFAEPGVEAFIRDVSGKRDAAGQPVLLWHALKCDDEIIAVSAGMRDDRRYSMMFNTYTLSENAHHSPGLILAWRIIDDFKNVKLPMLDLGIGGADYKSFFCKDEEMIFDSYLPLSAKGGMAASVLSALGRAKRAVKQSDRMMRAVTRIRQTLGR